MITARLESTALNRELKKLRHDIRLYQKYARMMGMDVRKYSRDRIRKQIDLSGSPFKARKDTANKRKMLIGIGKSMAVMSRASSGGGVVVGWKNKFEGDIARRQQHGDTEKMTAAVAKQRYGQPDYKGPCSKKQVKALVELGYRQPVPGKAGKWTTKRVPRKWIEQNLTLGQAGLILRTMRGEIAKSSWEITLPPRVFLGVTDQETAQITEKVAQNLTKNLK